MNNSNNFNRYDRRPYDSSKKKSFSNYNTSRPKNSNLNYDNNFNNNDRFSVQQSTTRNNSVGADVPDRNATTFDLSAAIMMGMEQHQKNPELSKDYLKPSSENSYLPRNRSENNFYNSNNFYNNDYKNQDINSSYKQGFNSTQSSSTRRFQNKYIPNDNSRWNNNNNVNNSLSSPSMNRGPIVSGNINSRYSGNTNTYNSGNHFPRSRFQGGSTYVPSNNSHHTNANYQKTNTSRFENTQPSNYNSQNKYQRSEYKSTSYNNNNTVGYNNYRDTRSISPSTVSIKDRSIQSNNSSVPDSNALLKDAVLNQPHAKTIEITNVVQDLDKNLNNVDESSDMTSLNVEKSEKEIVKEQQDEEYDGSIKLPLKKKQIIDEDHQEASDLMNDSEMETDAMETPLKPRLKALDDTVKTKVKTELLPTDHADFKKDELKDSKKSLISEIEAEAKYFSSLSGNSLNKQTINQRQSSIKRDPYGKTKLHTAVNKNDLSTVRKLIEEQGYDPNLQDYAGMTALHSACSKGFFNIVEYLVNLPSINTDLITEDNSETPLFDACVKLEVDIVRLLLEHNSKISIENGENKNVLIYMKEALEDEDYETEEDKEDLVKIIALLERYWPIVESQEESRDKEPKTKDEIVTETPAEKISSHYSSEEDSQEDEDNEELEFDVMDIASKYGKDRFYRASCRGDYNYVGQFLQNGGRPDKESFIECCKRGHMDLISLFLALTTMNVNMKISHSNGKNLLMVCCGRGNFNVVKLLVDSGADFMHVDDDGNDILYYVQKNKKAGWEKEYEFLKEKIQSKPGISRKKKEVSVPISPKRVVKSKSVTNTPKSPSNKIIAKSQDLSKSPRGISSASIDNAANAIKRKFYQLTEDDVVDTSVAAPTKTKKPLIIKKIKLGGKDESPGFLTPPSAPNTANELNNEALNSNSKIANIGTAIPVSTLKLSTAASVEPTEKTGNTPIEEMKQQKTREIFEQMEKYEQIKKEKEEELIQKQLEEKRLAEQEKQNIIKLREQELASLSSSLLCMGLQTVTNDNVPITLAKLANVGPIYYRVIKKQIYVLNAQLYYIFNGSEIISNIRNSVSIKRDDREMNAIWSFYKDLFLLGYMNDSKLVEFYEQEVLNTDSLVFKLQFETYQKSLLRNIELSWLPLNDILENIVQNNSYKHIVNALINNLIEIHYEENEPEISTAAEENNQQQQDPYFKQGIYFNDLPLKLKRRPVLREIITDTPLW